MFEGWTGPRADRRLGSCGAGHAKLAAGEWRSWHCSRPHTSKNDEHVFVPTPGLRLPFSCKAVLAGLHRAGAVTSFVARHRQKFPTRSCVRRDGGRSRFRPKGAGDGHPLCLRSVSRTRRRTFPAPAGPEHANGSRRTNRHRDASSGRPRWRPRRATRAWLSRSAPGTTRRRTARRRTRASTSRHGDVSENGDLADRAGPGAQRACAARGSGRRSTRGRAARGSVSLSGCSTPIASRTRHCATCATSETARGDDCGARSLYRPE